MKVKIDDKIYSGEEQPIMIILTDIDKENIKNMNPECTKYAQFPDDLDKDAIEDWMSTGVSTKID